MTDIIPIENDTTYVPPCTAADDPPNEIYWRGRQWAVTDYGIEALDGHYSVDAKSLQEDFKTWSWIRQLGDKKHVDLPDFTTAFMVAIVLHGRAPGFDRDQILGDFRRALKGRD